MRKPRFFESAGATGRHLMVHRYCAHRALGDLATSDRSSYIGAHIGNQYAPLQNSVFTSNPLCSFLMVWNLSVTCSSHHRWKDDRRHDGIWRSRFRVIPTRSEDCNQIVLRD